jgi:hypothetical protein
MHGIYMCWYFNFKKIYIRCDTFFLRTKTSTLYLFSADTRYKTIDVLSALFQNKQVGGGIQGKDWRNNNLTVRVWLIYMVPSVRGQQIVIGTIKNAWYALYIYIYPFHVHAC